MPATDPTSDAPALQVSGLVMRYGRKVAVDELDLSVDRGTITAVLGPNGAGKTTTLETCEGFRRPQGGEVRVLGLDPIRDRQQLLPRIGVMLQQGGAWTGVRAEEMLRHIASLHAHPLPVPMLVERLGLGDCGRTPYRRLSGGQKQRLALAMALVGRPELLFVDEPTAGMDPQARRDTWELLREVRADGVTTVLTTHYLEEAERLADCVHIIESGRVIASGTPDELTRASGQRTLRVTATRTLPDHLPDSLAADLGSLGEVHWVDPTTVLVHGELEAKALVIVTQWCERHDVHLDSMTFGRHTLEDVFLRLTGREFD